MESVSSLRIESLIPHRGAMRLIDRVLQVDDDHVLAELEVPFDGLFVRRAARRSRACCSGHAATRRTAMPLPAAAGWQSRRGSN